MDTVLHSLPEMIHAQEYVVATYFIKLPKEVDVIKKAESLAIGQTIGTWVPIPGITDEIREKYMGKVVNIFEIPAMELMTQIDGETICYIMQIAYPAANFGSDFPLMLTALLGNDASTSAQVKLMDIEFPEQFMKKFAGPRFGIEGIRKKFNIYERPLLLNMIKPCTGTSPEQGAEIFYQVAKGGVDLIKDDELFGNPQYNPTEKRTAAYKEAARHVYEETGHRTYYFANVTRGVDDLLDGIHRIEDAGADGLMVNFAILGYSTLKYIAENTCLPILGHSAGAGMYTEGTMNGMATPLAVGKLARLAGADIVMLNTPYGGYPLRKQKYMQTIEQLVLPLNGIQASMPSIGGGVHPGIVETYIKEAGKDIVLAAGGSIQGHTMGATAGAKAMRDAIDIACTGRDFLEAAKGHIELENAIARWGYVEKQ